MDGTEGATDPNNRLLNTSFEPHLRGSMTEAMTGSEQTGVEIMRSTGVLEQEASSSNLNHLSSTVGQVSLANQSNKGPICTLAALVATDPLSCCSCCVRCSRLCMGFMLMERHLAPGPGNPAPRTDDTVPECIPRTVMWCQNLCIPFARLIPYFYARLKSMANPVML